MKRLVFFNEFWIFVGLLVALGGVTAPARAEPSLARPLVAEDGNASATPTPSPGPGDATDPDFLLLPAYDFKRVESTEVKVGDAISLVAPGIPAPETAGRGLTVELPKGNSPLGDQGWVLARPTSQPTSMKSDHAGLLDLRLAAVPLKPGSLTLPPLLIVEKRTGHPVGRTNPWTVQVSSSIRKDDLKPTEPVPPRPPAELVFPWWVIVFFGLVALAVLLTAGILLHRAWRKRRPKAIAQAKAVLLPPNEEALAALLRLEKARPRDPKAHYHEVSEILKRYLGRRYEFSALESTTLELLAELAKRGRASEKVRQEVDFIFQDLDRVKFTDHLPKQEEPRAMIERARSLVGSTWIAGGRG